MECVLFIIFSLISFVCGEDYNLYGEAGQAYAIEANLGHPPQKLNLIVDTGSATLAVAAYSRQDGDQYFQPENSTSIRQNGTQIHAKYAQSDWEGLLASDYVQFPSLFNISEVISDMGLITKSHNFFMNDSGYQGLLGLAYPRLGARGENVVVESWLDFVDSTLNMSTSFELKLCGPTSVTNATHYGNFRVFDAKETDDMVFQTSILGRYWYKIIITSIRVIHVNTTAPQFMTDDGPTSLDVDMCVKLNAEASIVDSGTTNIRLPDEIFKQIVDEIKNSVQSSNVIILDDFWYHAEAACWPEPQEWSLPWLAIDIAYQASEQQYFTLHIPPQNYMRVASAHNSSGENGTVSEFCYKLGLEAGGKQTVLGYTAMEGFKVVFNRSGYRIGWETSNCGPNAKITGPYNISAGSIFTDCSQFGALPDVAISIKAAQWALCIISLVAAAVLIYLLAPCIKMILMRSLSRTAQMTVSETALVSVDT